jgi:hypothetical protein
MGSSENNAVFSLQEKGRIRFHLGYSAVQPVSNIQLGIQGSTQTQFLVEAAMDRVPESQAPQVRRLVSVLDGIEEKMISAQDRLAASVVDEITMNPDEPDKLEGEYTRWALRLADLLAVPTNPASRRFNAGKQSLSVPVRH